MTSVHVPTNGERPTTLQGAPAYNEYFARSDMAGSGQLPWRDGNKATRNSGGAEDVESVSGEKKSWRRLVLIVVALVVIVLILVAIVLIVYFVVIKKDNEEEPVVMVQPTTTVTPRELTEVSRTYVGTYPAMMRFIHEVYTPELQDSGSARYQQLHRRGCQLVDGVLGDIEGYVGCSVMDFGSGPSVDFRFTFSITYYITAQVPVDATEEETMMGLRAVLYGTRNVIEPLLRDTFVSFVESDPSLGNAQIDTIPANGDVIVINVGHQGPF